MRGEDAKLHLNSLYGKGSPPHARGRRSALASDEFWDGITPACAGKTDFSRSATRAFWDHPRMRGEDRLRISHNRPPYGSPPHARGRQHGRPPQVVSVGITPACAGKTPMKGPYEAHEPDHPRMRGEDRHTWSRLASVGGSPPHARGRPIGLEPAEMPPGITPACAGKTSPWSHR